MVKLGIIDGPEGSTLGSTGARSGSDAGEAHLRRCMKGVLMRRLGWLFPLGLLLAACGSSNASLPSTTPTRPAQPTAAATHPATPRATAATRPHPGSSPVTSPATPVVVAASNPYLAFLTATCRALAAGDAATITNELPYYQYNSGVRYGFLGDGEGQTGDPSLLGTWLQGGSVRCQYYTPDSAGHGTLLTSGWTRPGGWALIELDTYGGAWKINDFTFGGRSALYQAMQTSHPIVQYHGR
jgi:hypothetical protein